MPIDTRRAGRKPASVLALLVAVGVLTATACSPTKPSSPTSLSVGKWSGTTTQGATIAFEVTSSETLVELTIGHNFNGCSGTQTFSNLSVPTEPNVVCIPGPCSGSISAYRQFAYVNGNVRGSPSTVVNGVFFPGGSAQGQASFLDFAGCGTAAGVQWSATRR